MGRVICICLAWALAGVAPSWAKAPESPLPTPQFRHYEVADGLPSSNVTLIRQDARGLIWMTSGNGLVRYNGEHFRVYRHAPGHPDSLRGNVLSALAIDHDQRIWVGGDNTGLNVLDPATGHIRSWVHDKHDPHSLGGNDVDSLAVAPDGSLWVSVMGYGLDHMTGPGRFRHFIHRKGDPDSLSSNILFVIKALPDGSILAGGTGGLDHLGSDGHVRHVRFQGLADVPLVWGINGKPGDIRIATRGPLSPGIRRRGAAHVAGHLPASLTVTSLRAPDGSLWVGGGNGLYWIGPMGASPFRAATCRARGVPGTVIWSIFATRRRAVGGTIDGGVAYLRPLVEAFIVFHRHPGDPDASIDRVSSMLADGPDLLVGGDHGTLDRVDPATGAVRTALGRKMGSVMALAHAGPAACGSAQQGVQLKVAGTCARWARRCSRTASTSSCPMPGAMPTSTSSPGRCVSHRPSSLQRHQAEVQATTTCTRRHQCHRHARRPPVGCKHGRSVSTAGPRQYPGTGIRCVDGRVISFAFDSDGIWLARTDSLDHYHFYGLQASRDRMIGTDEGWPEVDVVTMSSDRRGPGVADHPHRPVAIRPEAGSFRSYGAEDGLPSPEFSVDAVATLPDGTEYTGTMHGVVGWNPAKVHDHPRPPRL